MLVEVCCNSLESALNAEEAGADRIELCSELGIGGVTPSFGLIQLVRERLKIPVHVLVRPRSAHFTYTETEFTVLLRDIEACMELGVDGIVSGVLCDDAAIDLERTKQVIALARPLHFTFHRAFDWVSDQKTALKQLSEIGVNTVLTSGQRNTAEQGMEQLKALQAIGAESTIMPGAGINASNAHRFKAMGFEAIHLSGTLFGNTVKIDQKIPMNSQKHLVEHEVAVTNTTLVRQIVQSVK
ncbi:copper homeostasis protein CutC [uncultured Croceitalea sp.]|uniref:copper homeostasis protein CutC n=1 Tax=uncultured Croceitalea sp. TaxID=1798908 RepID=UPI0033062862